MVDYRLMRALILWRRSVRVYCVCGMGRVPDTPPSWGDSVRLSWYVVDMSEGREERDCRDFLRRAQSAMPIVRCCCMVYPIEWEVVMCLRWGLVERRREGSKHEQANTEGARDCHGRNDNGLVYLIMPRCNVK